MVKRPPPENGEDSRARKRVKHERVAQPPPSFSDSDDEKEPEVEASEGEDFDDIEVPILFFGNIKKTFFRVSFLFSSKLNIVVQTVFLWRVRRKIFNCLLKLTAQILFIPHFLMFLNQEISVLPQKEEKQKKVEKPTKKPI